MATNAPTGFAPIAAFKTFLDQVFNNATARRDFRIQLRGNRAVVLFTVYLGVLCLLAIISYDSGLSRSSYSLVEAQSRLKGFYGTITGTLVFAILCIATAQGSFAVVTEKQRRSLELVFSAPVHPRYFLIGKLLGIYRFQVLVLVLAAPVLASCIMLGGATWTEALTGLWILSLQGMIYAAMGIVCSTVSTKPTGALSLALLVAILMVVASMMLNAVLAFGGLTRRGDVSFGVLFSIADIFEHATSSSTIFGVKVQNWIPFTAVALLMVQMLLLGSESLLSGLATKTVRSLRIAGIVYALLLPGLIWTSPSPDGKAISHFLGFAGCLIAALLVPTVTAFGFDELRKRRPNGWFNFREMLTGTPAGALPFLLTLLAAATVSSFFYPKLLGISVPDLSAIVPNLVLVLGFTLLLWGFGRAVSSLLTTIRSAKLLSAVLAIALVALPALFLSVSSGENFNNADNFGWLLYPFRSVFGPHEQIPVGFFWGGVFAASGVWLAILGERRLKTNLQQPRYRLYVEGNHS